MRIKIFLNCENCKRKNYITSKSQNNTEKISLRKHCNSCRSTIVHKEQTVKKGSN